MYIWKLLHSLNTNYFILFTKKKLLASVYNTLKSVNKSKLNNLLSSKIYNCFKVTI